MIVIPVLLLVANLMCAGWNLHTYLQSDELINMLVLSFNISAAILSAIWVATEY